MKEKNMNKQSDKRQSEATGQRPRWRPKNLFSVNRMFVNFHSLSLHKNTVGLPMDTFFK